MHTDPSRIFEHHGDYQCSGVPDGPQPSPSDITSPGSTENPHKGITSGGLECFTESVPDGYGKLLTRPLGLEGDINDIRAPNSTVLEWYYQLAARWVPKLDCSEYPHAADDDETDIDVAEPSQTTAAAAPTTVVPKGPQAKSEKKQKRKQKLPSAVHPRPKAMSFHNFTGPGYLDEKQSSLVFNHQVHNATFC